MKLLKDITDITFGPENPMEYGPFNDPDMEVSEPLVMKSAAGWYIGSIARTPMELDDYLYEPYDRYTVYYNTSYEPEQMLRKSQDTNPNHRLCLTSVLT